MVRIELLPLAVGCQRLAKHAGSIIRTICASGKLEVVNKAAAAAAAASASSASSASTNNFDPQTEADRQAQTIIVGGLRHHFPGITVIGEEEQDDANVPPAVLAPSFFDNLSANVDLSRWPQSLTSASLEDVCVWVDPVDGTSGLTRGCYDCVTVLIGVSIKGVATIGVIHSPFDERMVWGATGYGIVDSTGVLPRQVSTSPAESSVVVTSRSHFDKQVESFLNSLSPPPSKIIRSGGCGAKILMVLDGKADAYLYPREGTKKWDSCAGDVLLRVAGGKLTDTFGDELDYSANAEHMNSNGLVCTLGSIDHQQFLRQKQ